MNQLPPIHPGEILRDQYLEPLTMSPYALAKRLGVPRTRVERIVKEKVGITADTALRLSKFFNTTPQFWLNLQSSFDLKNEADRIADDLSAIHPIKR